MASIDTTMQGALLPGDSTTLLKEFPVPQPGHGEVLIRMKASTICGSDIRCIYHEHLGQGPEGYQDLHPADLVTHRFALPDISKAYALMASGRCGKVAVCFDDELTA